MVEAGTPRSVASRTSSAADATSSFAYAGHGAGGEEFNDDYYRAASAPKRIWRIAEAKHTGGFAARPRDYERRVVGFFDEALQPRAPDSLAPRQLGR